MHPTATDLPAVPSGWAPASWPPAYLEFFNCFNAGRYFEAHEVLEALWLPVRGRGGARFYQGLIQVAGAFVHLQRGRAVPARALLRRSQEHLAHYPDRYLGLDLVRLRAQLDAWQKLADDGAGAGLTGWHPRLELPELEK